MAAWKAARNREIQTVAEEGGEGEEVIVVCHGREFALIDARIE